MKKIGKKKIGGFKVHPTVPVIILASFLFIVSIRNKYRLILLFGLFVSNLFWFPFKRDGARLPNWGSDRADVAEYTYPYDKAIAFLVSEAVPKSLVVAGQYSEYKGLRFYFDRYNFNPKTVDYPFGTKRFEKEAEISLFNSFIQNLGSEENQVDAILYHSVNNIDLVEDAEVPEKYKISKVENSLHSLYIIKPKGEN